MKKAIFQIILMLLCFTAQGQKVSNSRAEQRGQDIVVFYSLETSSPCEVSLMLSTDNGSTWSGALTKVSGDVGKNISAGEKQIIWRVLEEREQLVGDKIRFKIVLKKKEINRNNETRISEYCSGAEYKTTRNAFRSTAAGESMDRETAKRKSRANALTEMAKTISATMKIVGDNYVNSTEVNNKKEFTKAFNEMARTVVDQELRGCIEICEKLYQRPDGTYDSYVALELSVKTIADAYHNGLSKNDKIKADYNYEVFEKIFEREMYKLSDF